MEQDVNCPKYLFHGSPKLLDNVEIRKSYDSKGNERNIDVAVFVTSSFLLATAYAFKDKIKEKSLKNGLKYSFDIKNRLELPIMIMDNVIIPDELEGYVYVFEYNDNFVNDPAGSLQYKAYDNLRPIDIIKINYDDFKSSYEIKKENEKSAFSNEIVV